MCNRPSHGGLRSGCKMETCYILKMEIYYECMEYRGVDLLFQQVGTEITDHFCSTYFCSHLHVNCGHLASLKGRIFHSDNMDRL